MNVNLLLSVLLLVVVLGPAASAVLLATLGRTHARLPRRLAVYLSALHVVVTVGLLVLYSGFVHAEASKRGALGFGFQPKAVPGDPGQKGEADSFAHTTAWKVFSLGPNAPAVEFFVGLDGLNVLLVTLTSLMFFFAVLVSWDTVTDRPASYYAWLFALQTAVLGTFVSFDVLLFYVFFELTLVPAFFLIGQWGTGSARRDAARKFVLYTLFGSLFTLVGIVGVVLTNPVPIHPASGQAFYYEPAQESVATPKEADGPYVMARPGPVTFAIPTLMRNVSMWDAITHHAAAHAEARLAKAAPGQKADREKELAEAREARKARSSTQFWLFLALMAGFAVKVPIVPFHTWMPTTYRETPLAVTMLFSAVLAKLGTYGILRVVIPLVPEACVQYGLPWFGVLGAVGIVYAAFCAFAQRDLRLVAGYSSVSHLGLLVIGLFALNPEALSGAVLHMVNHGLSAGAMFALLSFLARRYRTLDVTHYGGLWAKYPRFTFLSIVIVLAGVGLPGLNNFVSEMLILGGLFDPRNLKLAGWGLAAVAAFGVFLSSWYLFTLLRRVFFGPLVEPPVTAPGGPPPQDVSGRELVPLAALAALCVTLGLFPQPLLDVANTEVERVSGIVTRARLRLDPTAVPPEAPRPPEEPRTFDGVRPPPMIRFAPPQPPGPGPRPRASSR